MTNEPAASLLVRGGHVVDPATGTDGPSDVLIQGGRIADVAPSLPASTAHRVIDAEGMLVLPGLVDSHVHLTDLAHDSPTTSTDAYRRLAEAGVTTAVEYFDVGRALDQWSASTAGLTMLGLQGIRAHDGTAARATLRDEIAAALRNGAIGVKLLGGHFPNTPETSALVIEEADALGAYCAFHAGTSRYGSNLDGMREAIELADGHPLHVAHTNAYLRGAIDYVEHENRVAVELLLRAQRVVSESHLAALNLCLGSVTDGVLDDRIVANCLRHGGYPADVAGLARAFGDGFAYVLLTADGGPTHLTGDDGLRLWRADPDRTALNFPVNNRLSALAQACARVDRGGTVRWEGEGEFVVDAISSDGGSWRNVILAHGLPLVRFGALSLRQLVHKACRQPALLYGLTNKGHLAPGADGDVVVVDPNTAAVGHTIACGRVIYDGRNVATGGGKVITTADGVAGVTARGIKAEVVDLQGSLLRTRTERSSAG